VAQIKSIKKVSDMQKPQVPLTVSVVFR